MTSAYQIHCAMEAAQTPSDLAGVLALHASDVLAIEDRGHTVDVNGLRKAAMVHAERVSGLSFTRLLTDALSNL